MQNELQSNPFPRLSLDTLIHILRIFFSSLMIIKEHLLITITEIDTKLKPLYIFLRINVSDVDYYIVFNVQRYELKKNYENFVKFFFSFFKIPIIVNKLNLLTVDTEPLEDLALAL